MQKDKKQKPIRWSFEPSAETIRAYQDFLRHLGKYGDSVNKSKVLDTLVLDGLIRELTEKQTIRSR